MKSRSLFADLPPAVRALVAAGAAAPSADNGQPWRFIWRDTLDLVGRFDDASSPPDDLATVIALGAAVENVVQVCDAFNGYVPVVRGADSKQWRDAIVARFTVRANLEISEDLYRHPLFGRHTNRFPFSSAPIQSQILEQLRSAHESSSARCLIVDERDTIMRTGQLIRRASEIRFQTKDLHEAFAASLRFSSREVATGTGLDVRTLALPIGGQAFLRFSRSWKRMRLLNRLGAYKMLARAEARSVQQAPALVLILSAVGFEAALAAGRLMERVWIMLHTHGIAVHPYFVISDQLDRLRRGKVPATLLASANTLRDDVTHEFAVGKYQLAMILRIGSPTVQASRAARLPLEQIVTT